MSTSGWSASGLPALSPNPGTMLSTPSGRPASFASRPSASVASGDCSAGFRTTELPADQRRPDLPGGDDQRIVPRHDRADDAERLLPHHRDVVCSDRRDLVVELVGELGVVLDAVGGEGDVDIQGVGDHLADVERLEQGELVAVGRE